MFDVLFESKFEHHVCLIKDHRLEIGKVDIPSLDMIFDSSSGTHEKVDSPLETISLVLDIHSSIYRNYPELIITMLHFGELVSYLNGQFSSRS